LEVDFWGDSWSRYAGYLTGDHPQSCALTAKGGSGKSTIAAHIVRSLLRDDPHCMPVVIDQPQQYSGSSIATVISEAAGAWSMDVLLEYVGRLKLEGTNVFFIIDGLDRIGRASNIQEGFLLVLRELSKTNSLLVTCRTEVWNDDFALLGIR